MSVRDELSLLTPRLRRYARALTQARRRRATSPTNSSTRPSCAFSIAASRSANPISSCRFSRSLTQINRESSMPSRPALRNMPQAAVSRAMTAWRAPVMRICCRKGLCAALGRSASRRARGLASRGAGRIQLCASRAHSAYFARRPLGAIWAAPAPGSRKPWPMRRRRPRAAGRLHLRVVK